MAKPFTYRELVFTHHALDRLKERQVDLGDVWYTWRRPDKTEPGNTPESFKYIKSKSDQTIEVVAKKNDQGEWIILSVWAKKKGQNKPVFTTPNFWQTLKKALTKQRTS